MIQPVLEGEDQFRLEKSGSSVTKPIVSSAVFETAGTAANHEKEHEEPVVTSCEPVSFAAAEGLVKGVVATDTYRQQAHELDEVVSEVQETADLVSAISWAVWFGNPLTVRTAS